MLHHVYDTDPDQHDSSQSVSISDFSLRRAFRSNDSLRQAQGVSLLKAPESNADFEFLRMRIHGNRGNAESISRARSESITLGPRELIMTTKNRRTSGNHRYAYMPICLFNAATRYFHPPVLFAPFLSIVGCNRVGIAIPE